MTWEIDPIHTSVEFSVRHMMVAKVRGGFSKVQGAIELDEEDPTQSEFQVEIDVASIDTQDAQRDAHLRSPDFFDVERFPTMTYRSRWIQRSGDGYRVIGDLTIHGETREVPLNVEFVGTAADPWGNVRAGFSAEATINRKDFGLNWNTALEAGGFLVGDKVKITVEAEAIKQTAVGQAA